ncbi:hypothetical protein [Streptomyces sp. NPDC003996]
MTALGLAAAAAAELRGRRDRAVCACAVTVLGVPHGTGRPELHQGSLELMLSALYAAAGALIPVAVRTSSPERDHGAPRYQAVTKE